MIQFRLEIADMWKPLELIEFALDNVRGFAIPHIVVTTYSVFKDEDGRCNSVL